MTYARFLLPAHNPSALSGASLSLFSWLIWAIFGNADDGPTGPAGFQSARPDWQRRILWWLRNPAHNLMFYVLGCAHLGQEREGAYPLSVFAHGGGLNWAISRVRPDQRRAPIDGACFALWFFLCLLPFGWNWLICLPMSAFYLLRSLRDSGWMPFISYESPRIKAYIGWRERGNFGIKFNLVRP